MDADPVISALQDALTRDPHPELQLALGDRWLTLREPAEALGCYQEVLAGEPANIPALVRAAAAADAAGAEDTAAGYRRLVSAMTTPLGEGAVFPALPPPREGRPGLRLVPDSEPPPSAATRSDGAPLPDVLSHFAGRPDPGGALRLRSYMLSQLGRHGEALEVAREAVALTPDDAAAVRRLARALWAFGDRSAALDAARRAAALDPAAAEGLGHLSDLAYELGHVDEALDAAKRAVARAPDTGWAHLVLGDALDLAGRPYAALEAFTQALQRDPDSRYARARRSTIWRVRIRNDLVLPCVLGLGAAGVLMLGPALELWWAPPLFVVGVLLVGAVGWAARIGHRLRSRAPKAWRGMLGRVED